ncbi:MAG: transposase, partial [Acidobacteria bacterium]|nr:transposase [Acidobacteriota bacterium]
RFFLPARRSRRRLIREMEEDQMQVLYPCCCGIDVHAKTVVVLDNASIHTAGIIKERLGVWQARGLFIFYLPRYSPHLNIAEVLWRKLKYEWLSPLDYVSKENLFYTVRQALAAVGTSLRINFSKFSLV